MENGSTRLSSGWLFSCLEGWSLEKTEWMVGRSQKGRTVASEGDRLGSVSKWVTSRRESQGYEWKLPRNLRSRWHWERRTKTDWKMKVPGRWRRGFEVRRHLQELPPEARKLVSWSFWMVEKKTTWTGGFGRERVVGKGYCNWKKLLLITDFGNQKFRLKTEQIMNL